MTNRKLGAFQIGTVIFFLTRCSFSLFGYQRLFKNTGSDAICVSFLASILAITLFLSILKLRKRKKVLFKNCSKKIVSVFFLFLLFLFLFYLKKTIALIQMEFIDTSFIFLALSLILLSFLLTRGDLLSLSNSTIFLFFPFLFFFLITFLGGIPLVNLDYLKPFLLKPSTSFYNSILITFLSFLPACIFLLFLPYDSIDHKDKQEKTLFFSFILGCLSVLLEVLLMHLTLGSNLTAIYPYPLFALTSRIASFLIFDRVFFLFSFYLLFDSTILLSILALFMRNCIRIIKEDR